MRPVKDLRLDFDERGEGPPVLLIHGFPLDRRIWDAQIPVLAKRFRVIAPDLRGHGRTSAPEGPYSLDLYASDLLRLMDTLDVAKFAAAGHSMGGYILLAMHRLAPERLQKIALVTTRAKADDEAGKKNREATAERVLAEGPGFLADAMAERVLAANPREDVVRQFRAIIRSQNPIGIAEAARAMARRPDATGDLASIRVPTLVLLGREDKLVPPEETRAMAAAIPGATLVEIPGTSHLPMMEQPEATTRALFEFFSGEMK